MQLRLMIVAAVLLCSTAWADAVRGTPIRVASIYLSPDSSSNKLAEIERGREVGFHDFVAKFDRPGLVAAVKEQSADLNQAA